MTVQVKDGEIEKLPRRHFSRSLSSKMFCREKNDELLPCRWLWGQPSAQTDSLPASCARRHREDEKKQDVGRASLRPPQRDSKYAVFFLSSRSSERQTTLWEVPWLQFSLITATSGFFVLQHFTQIPSTKGNVSRAVIRESSALSNCGTLCWVIHNLL